MSSRKDSRAPKLQANNSQNAVSLYMQEIICWKRRKKDLRASSQLALSMTDSIYTKPRRSLFLLKMQKEQQQIECVINFQRLELNEVYLWLPSLLTAFTRDSFFQRPSPKPIMRSPFAAGATPARYFANGAALKHCQQNYDKAQTCCRHALRRGNLTRQPFLYARHVKPRN